MHDQLQTDELNSLPHTEPLDTPSTVDSTIAESIVTGTADPGQHQVSSRLLTVTTPTKSETIKTTGLAQTPPIQAQGTVTFYNEATYEQTIGAGTVLAGSDGVQVVTDETAYVKPGN